jgi:catechol 2,3-dioxygenase-like lactoylglutathione lyase family enzyme
MGDIMAGLQPSLSGVHHTARPTWKLKQTVDFYHGIMGLPIVHAISAVGWGPEGHPDFIHLFFGAGGGSTIAFFYYLGLPPVADPLPPDSWLYKSVHTAWQVDSRAALLDVLQVRHEIIESIYVTDPNGYMIELTWQVRPMSGRDQLDAELTLEAAIGLEAECGAKVTDIERVWRRKAQLVRARLAEAG